MRHRNPRAIMSPPGRPAGRPDGSAAVHLGELAGDAGVGVLGGRQPLAQRRPVARTAFARAAARSNRLPARTTASASTYRARNARAAAAGPPGSWRRTGARRRRVAEAVGERPAQLLDPPEVDRPRRHGGEQGEGEDAARQGGGPAAAPARHPVTSRRLPRAPSGHSRPRCAPPPGPSPRRPRAQRPGAKRLRDRDARGWLRSTSDRSRSTTSGLGRVLHGVSVTSRRGVRGPGRRWAAASRACSHDRGPGGVGARSRSAGGW